MRAVRAHRTGPSSNRRPSGHGLDDDSEQTDRALFRPVGYC